MKLEPNDLSQIASSERDRQFASTEANLDTMYVRAIRLRFQGNQVEAIGLLRKLLTIQPNHVAGSLCLADLLKETEQWNESVFGFEHTLRLDPNCLEAALKLGVLWGQKGRSGEAAHVFSRAVKIDGNSAIARRYFGMALNDLKGFDEAIVNLQMALKLEPMVAETYLHLGHAFSGLGKLEDAVVCYSAAAENSPQDVIPHLCLGSCWAQQSRLEEAKTSFWKALSIDPNCALAFQNLGIASESEGKLDEAYEHFSRAIQIDPQLASAHVNLGVILDRHRRYDEAEKSFHVALSVAPENIPAKFNLGMLKLRNGDWKTGFGLYELRMQLPGATKLSGGTPIWDGDSLAGKTILVRNEQGLGDCIQFARYLPLVKNRGGRVLLRCRRSMLGLLSTCAGIDELIDVSAPLPKHDVLVPMLSLPRIFGTTPDNVPNMVPYLKAHQAREEAWEKRLAEDKGYKIGIVWRGNPGYSSDKRRSVRLENFQPIGQLNRVQFYSLQKEDVSEEIDSMRHRFQVRNFGSELDKEGAFLDTAAIMKSLDLVISVDSSSAHLAGALGIPVWLALAYSADWRWMLDREDTPWYPTMRLFRQSSMNGWGDVFERMAGELRTIVKR